MNFCPLYTKVEGYIYRDVIDISGLDSHPKNARSPAEAETVFDFYLMNFINETMFYPSRIWFITYTLELVDEFG